jgi:hypothetical protein
VVKCEEEYVRNPSQFLWRSGLSSFWSDPYIKRLTSLRLSRRNCAGQDTEEEEEEDENEEKANWEKCNKEWRKCI